MEELHSTRIHSPRQPEHSPTLQQELLFQHQGISLWFSAALFSQGILESTSVQRKFSRASLLEH